MHIKEAIQNILDKNLDEMKSNFNSAITEKAIEKLEEKKIEIASTYFAEASYSAKSARAGKDIGKPGKMFAKIAADAAERYGSEERGKKVAGAVLKKLRSKE